MVALGPEKGPFLPAMTNNVIMKEKQDISPRPLGSFWKSWQSVVLLEARHRILPVSLYPRQPAAVAGAFVRRRQGSASALPAQPGPSVTPVRAIPSASTPWLAARAATAPGWALLLGPPRWSATGTTGSAGELSALTCTALSWEGTTPSATRRSLLPISHGFRDCTMVSGGCRSTGRRSYMCEVPGPLR